MRIVLTGATGFIGKRLIQQFLNEGHEVSVLGRSRPKDSRASHFWWDAMKGEPLDASLIDVDAVINLVGEPVAQRWDADVKRRIRESRVTGTRNLINALARQRRLPRVLVSASASGYYGERGDEVLTERSAPGQGFLSDVCVEWEREAMRATDFGIRVALVRIGIVLGPDGGALERMLPPFRMGVGGKLGDGKQWMSWIHVDDLVSLLAYSMEADAAQGPLNGVAPEPVRNSQFTETLASVIHRPALFPAPKFGLKLIFGEMADIVTGSQRIVPEATQRTGFSWRYPSLRAALEQATR
jgi:uncharacterized protein